MNAPLPPDIIALRDRYLAAQLDGDRAAALLVLDDGIVGGLSPLDLDVDIVGAAQREIGRLWQENKISIADEHTATAISQLALAHLYSRLSRGPRNGKRIVLGCVEGEQHDMGPRIATDLLEAAGFAVRLLGASVPTESLVELVARESPDLLALSATMTFHLAALRDAVARVRAAVGEGLPIIVGGHVFGGVPAASLGPGVYATHGTARDLVDTARRLLGVAA